MSHLEKISKMETAEVRAYVKEAGDDLINEIVWNKEKAVALLLKHKALPDAVIEKLSETKRDAEFLLDALIEANYTPSLGFIEKILSVSGDLAGEAISAFPTIPYTAQFLMVVINNGLHGVAAKLLEIKPELKKDDVLFLLVKEGAKEDFIIDAAIESEKVRNFVLDTLAEDGDVKSLPVRLIDASILKASEGVPKGFSVENLSGLNLSQEAYEKILSDCRYNEKLEWTPEIEKIERPAFLGKIRIINAPEGSRYRRAWISYQPQHATDDELVELCDSYNGVTEDYGYYRSSWASRNKRNGIAGPFNVALDRGLKILQRIDVKRIENFIGPTALGQEIKDSPTEVKLYLFENLSSKYRPHIKKTMSKEELGDKARESKKKSYFPEILDALNAQDIDAFREAYSQGYSLEQFAKDSHQSSKKDRCNNTQLGYEFAKKLTKDEFLTLCLSEVSFQRYYSCNNQNQVLPYKLTLNEIDDVVKKLGISFCFRNSANQLEFLEKVLLNKELLESLAKSDTEHIASDEDLFAAFLKASKPAGSISIDESSIKVIAPKIKRDQALELIKDESITGYGMRELLMVKCSDGKYLVSEEMIKKNLRRHIESHGFMKSLMERDQDLSKQFIDAYLDGNKAMSALAGDKVNIKRSKVDNFEGYKTYLEKGPEAIINELIESGADLAKIKKAIPDWQNALSKYAKGKKVPVGNAGIHSLNMLGELTSVTFMVENLVISLFEESLKVPENVQIKSMDVEISGWRLHDNHSSDEELEKFVGIINSFSETVGSITIIRGGLNAGHKLRLFKAGLKSIPIEEIVAQAREDIDEVSPEDLSLLLDNGLIADDELVFKILDGYLSKRSAGNLLVIAKRIGGLSNFCASDNSTKSLETDLIESLKEAGLKIITAEQYNFESTLDDLDAAGANFEDIDVSNFSTKRKLELIKYIEKYVDPNFAKLNLASINFDGIEVISNYAKMRASHSLNDEDVAQLLKIPSSISSNKKIMKAIKDYITLSGSGVLSKSTALISAVEKINPSIEITLQDLMNYDNPHDVTESQTLAAVNLSTLDTIVKRLGGTNLILKGQDKVSVLRFIRSTGDKEKSYIGDVFDMVNSVIGGVDAMKGRLGTLREENDEAAAELEKSLDGVMKRLEEVSAMDDIVHMHDRLVPLLQFIKSDPIQVIGQDKMKKLENDARIAETLGHSLFFPKTRGDLQELGNRHGWCVSYHSSYGDGVRDKGNILVGICEGESSVDNTVALAHFLNKGNGNYQLEQLKWSKLKNNGRTNVDATRDFNYRAIIDVIKSHLEKLKDIDAIYLKTRAGLA